MRFIGFISFISLAFLHVAGASAQQNTQVAFSPSPQAIALIQKTIGEAEHNIEMAAYSFTSYKIANALIRAHRRGVEVRVVLDKSESDKNYKAINDLRAENIPIHINSNYAIMHDKYMVIDNQTVQTGSFNYTESAERRNAENVLVIKDEPELAKGYEENWQKLWDEGK